MRHREPPSRAGRAACATYRPTRAVRGAPAIHRETLTQKLTRTPSTPETDRELPAPSALVALREMVSFASGEWSAGAALSAAADLIANVTGSDQVLVLRHADRGDEVAGEVGTGLRIGALVESADSRLGERAQIRVGDVTWGEIRAVRSHPDVALGELAGVVARTLAETERRRALARRSVRDPLTGLARIGVFEDGLDRALRRSDRHDEPLSLVLTDVDGLARLNEEAGRPAGDRVIVGVAQILAEAARGSDLLARIAGQRFGWVLPGATGAEATGAAERVRAAVRATQFPVAGGVTVSLGVAEWAGELGAGDLIAAADAALYRAKVAGRDRVVRSDRVPAPTERSEGPSVNAQALVALRALARAVDAKDPSTHRHSSRVALLAERLAEEIGWPAEDLRRIADAAVLHDVGKLLVSDDILAKPGPLTDAEFAEVMRHPAAGAEIASEVLDADQTSWIRHHHERWDGTGYPERLTGPAIPHGARLLAVADAWDVMTQARHYREPLTVDEALVELRDHAGTQFDPELAAALADLIGRRAPGSVAPL